MKAVAITGVVALVIIGGMTFIPSVNETVNKTIEVEKQVEVDALQKRIEEATSNAQASTTAKAQAAYDKVIKDEEARIADEVKATYIKEIQGTMSAE